MMSEDDGVAPTTIDESLTANCSHPQASAGVINMAFAALLNLVRFLRR
jgi:hypothetical protein